MDGLMAADGDVRPRLVPADIPGCFVIDPMYHSDERGHFVKLMTPSVLSECNFELENGEVFWSASFRGVLRGLHYQRQPSAVSKVIWCASGSIYDVVLDLRPDSRTYARWAGFEVNAANGLAVVVPVGCAHGFLTLSEEAAVCYLQSGPFDADCDSGIRWDTAGIDWPGTGRAVTTSARDSAHPSLDEFLDVPDV